MNKHIKTVFCIGRATAGGQACMQTCLDMTGLQLPCKPSLDLPLSLGSSHRISHSKTLKQQDRIRLLAPFPQHSSNLDLPPYREAEAKREKQTREGLLVIATKAALAEQELMTARLHEEGRRLGALTTIVGGHLGELLCRLCNWTVQQRIL